ncbi:Alpha-crystallin B chain [Halotydeus destructor]|nr:Alpha-crystallin B chain [Halotydeus destructor]
MMSSWIDSDDLYGQDHQGDTGTRRRRTQSDTVNKSPIDVENDQLAHHANFRVRLDVRQFQPHEVTVQHDGEIVSVHGRHAEQSPTHGFISREFTRKYEIPKDVDPDKVTCSWHPNNILVIKAPRDSAPRPALDHSPARDPSPTVEMENLSVTNNLQTDL